MESWQNAVTFAARKHHGQLRKDDQTPYIAHPLRVALTVRHLFEIDDRVALCAAVLHDVIEDTDTDYDEILDRFGGEVADAVAALTKDMRLPEGDREIAYDTQLSRAPWQARAVKLADVYDNICDCESAGMLRSALLRAERAIICAADEPLLEPASRLLRSLIDRRGPTRS